MSRASGARVMRNLSRFAWQLTRTRIPLSETDFELSVTTSYDGDEAPENDPPNSPTTDQTKWVTRTSLRANCANHTPGTEDGMLMDDLQTRWCFRH